MATTYEQALVRMIKGFSTLDTVNQVKLAYRKLASKYHPDKGGCGEAFKALQKAYLMALKAHHEEKVVGDDGETRTYYYHEQRETSVMNKVNDILAENMSGVDIQLIGTWLWCTGNTRAHIAALKRHKMRYHSRREAWYWHAPTRRRTRYNAAASLDDLAESYGSRTFTSGRSGNVTRH